jgi:hypothetical protein
LRHEVPSTTLNLPGNVVNGVHKREDLSDESEWKSLPCSLICFPVSTRLKGDAFDVSRLLLETLYPCCPKPGWLAFVLGAGDLLRPAGLKSTCATACSRRLHSQWFIVVILRSIWKDLRRHDSFLDALLASVVRTSCLVSHHVKASSRPIPSFLSKDASLISSVLGLSRPPLLSIYGLSLKSTTLSYRGEHDLQAMGRPKASLQLCSSKSRVTASLLLSFLALTNRVSAASTPSSVSALVPETEIGPATGAVTYHDFVCRFVIA